MRRAVGLVAALAVAALATAPAQAARSRVGITVLSSRADLVSGDSALVRVSFSRARDARHVAIHVGRRSIRGAFARSGSRRLLGVATGLRPGRNVLTVRLRNGRG